MNKNLSNIGLATIIIKDHTVYLNGHEEILEANPKLIFGRQSSIFSRTNNDEVRKLNYCQNIRPDYADSRRWSASSLNENVDVFINKYEDFSIANSKTVQISLRDKFAPAKFSMENFIRIPPHDNEFVFSAYVAAHRAIGSAELVLSTSSREEVIEHFIVDGEYQGGRQREQFKRITITLPPLNQSSALSLHLKHLEHREEYHDNTSFYFFGDLVVSAANETTVQENAIIYNSEDTERATHWFKANVSRVLNREESLVLKIGDDEIELIGKLPTGVEFDFVSHDQVKYKCEDDMITRVLIDNMSAFSADLIPAGSKVQIPSKLYDGGHHLISFRDISGTQEWWSGYVYLPNILTPYQVLQKESTYPYPGHLASQARHRYESMVSSLGFGIQSSQNARQIYNCIRNLEAGPDNVVFHSLEFQKHEKPKVSIIIPAHNKFEYTYITLCSLLTSNNKASYEVIVVDDGSKDLTNDIESIVSGITIVRNELPQRFIRACNAGAQRARGEYITLLNNDVEVTTGWLDELLEVFQQQKNVGAAGSKLLYPDGSLQDAGGIVWRSGNPWNYGNRQNPWDPKFCYSRQVDYLSGAALMTSKTVWHKVGGLSQYLEPMYFEDTDYAFKVRDAGYATYFVPSSIVYHHEGVTSGTDTREGFKRFQEVNRPKFKRTWSRAYSNNGIEGNEPDLEKDRKILGRVLFLDYASPRPDRDAGSYAALQEIKLVQSLGYKVTFLAENLAHMGKYTDALQKMGVEVPVAPFYRSVNEFLSKRGQEFDAFYITRFYIADNYISTIRKINPTAPIILNNADLHFLRELRSAIQKVDKSAIDKALITKEKELAALRKADIVLSYNKVEHSVINSHLHGEVPVLTCPWVVDVPKKVPPVSQRSGLSFLGSGNHYPNVEGLEWFLSEVVPNLELMDGDNNLHIHGYNIEEKIGQIDSEHVIMKGFVELIEEAYNPYRVFVAPLLSGAGIKGKVLSALAFGIPTILSDVAAEGIGLRHDYDCLIANTPSEWLKSIEMLQNDDRKWKDISMNARQLVRNSYGFDTGKTYMKEAFEAVGLYASL